MYDHHREMSKATGVKKKTNESEKAKAVWAMKAAKDRERNTTTWLAERTFLGRNRTRLELRDEHLKDPIIALGKAFKCLENPHCS